MQRKVKKKKRKILMKKSDWKDRKQEKESHRKETIKEKLTKKTKK